LTQNNLRVGRRRIQGVLSALSKYKLALGAFLIPLIIRSIPEIIVGPYPVGWDVITYYVPNVLDIASGTMSIWGIIATPVLYAIVAPIYVVTRISPIWILKFLGPILYGLLGLSIFTFCRRRLQWQQAKSFYAVLFISAYFIVMRIAWDAYRMELGLAFLLFAESIVGATISRKTELAKVGLLSLAILSNQLVGVLVGAIVLARFARFLSKRNFALASLQSLPMAFFLLVVYATLQTTLSTGLGVVGGSTDIASIPTTILFLLYAYVAVLPLVYFGLKSFRKPIFTIWIIACFGGIALSALPGHVFQDIANRWVLLLSIPTLLVAYEGYTKLRESMVFSHRAWTGVLRIVVIVGLAVTATLFAVLPAQSASPLYTAFTQYVPSSMVQSTMPSSDYAYVVGAMTWVNTHMNSDSVLITQQAFYGWAREYLSSGRMILNCYLNSPSTMLAQAGPYTHVYTVWWIQGAGWFQNSFPTGAQPVVSFGDIAVYQFR
jgi:hypothetical protein